MKQAFIATFTDRDGNYTENRVWVILRADEAIIDAVDRVIEQQTERIGYYPDDLEVVPI